MRPPRGAATLLLLLPCSATYRPCTYTLSCARRLPQHIHTQTKRVTQSHAHTLFCTQQYETSHACLIRACSSAPSSTRPQVTRRQSTIARCDARVLRAHSCGLPYPLFPSAAFSVGQQRCRLCREACCPPKSAEGLAWAPSSAPWATRVWRQRAWVRRRACGASAASAQWRDLRARAQRRHPSGVPARPRCVCAENSARMRASR